MRNLRSILLLMLLVVVFSLLASCSQNGEETEGAKWDELIWDKDKWN